MLPSRQNKCKYPNSGRRSNKNSSTEDDWTSSCSRMPRSVSTEGSPSISQYSRLTSGFESGIMKVRPFNGCKTKKSNGSLSNNVDKQQTPTVVELKLSESQINPLLQRHTKCSYSPQRKHPAKTTRGIQTLYRESSMQTLPYLPEVSTDKAKLPTLELFKLSKIVKGDGPPGVAEVELLERSRRRWAFEKAFKEKFTCAMKKARSELERQKLLPRHRAVLEAFEWEDWLEREELIQGCQILRFQLVLGIFEKREREMHNASTVRLQKSCADIIQKRDVALRKNNIEFGREMRRLKMKHENRPRNWRKEKISDQLGNPSSEFYAPQMRYGVNPNRRHFQLSRKAFEMRMEDLEKRSVNMKNLECPFAKLKQWSKPKVQVPEVEPNFCTDANLQKLYEALKNLREQSKKQKIVPKCLVAKHHVSVDVSINEDLSEAEELEVNEGEEECTQNFETEDDDSGQFETDLSQCSLLEMNSQMHNQNLTTMELLDERCREEMESMMAEFEGGAIGWLMRFLSEEMSRLKEQRKLHFITMLAQKERWRREAAEAGLRQKENEMRKIYEEIFYETNKANNEVCDNFLDNIFDIDAQEQADFAAVSCVTEMANVIDQDLLRWVKSFELIQNPLNYDNLRCLLRDLVFPECQVERLVQKFEAQSIVASIINDVLFHRVNCLLEPFDISSSLTNELIDRLIDNDLYLFSSECSSSCDCQGKCACRPPQLEAKAILRKLVRYSVPGRRWRTSTERIAAESLHGIVDDVCKKLKEKPKRISRRLNKASSKINLHLTASQMDEQEILFSGTSSSGSTEDFTTVITYNEPRDTNFFELPVLTKSNKLFWADSQKSVSSRQNVDNLSAGSQTSPSPVSLSLSNLKEGQSAYDFENPMQRVLEESSSESEFSKQVFQKQTNLAKIRSKKLEDEISRSFFVNIINEVIKFVEPTEASETFEPSETVESEAVEPEAVESLEASKSTIAPSQAMEKLIVQLIECEESYEMTTETTSSCPDRDVLEESPKFKEQYEMVLYEGDLKSILNDDDDECLCQMEIDNRNRIRDLYEAGKIKVIHMQPPTKAAGEDKQSISLRSKTASADLDINAADLLFEGTTSAQDDISNQEKYFLETMEEENINEHAESEMEIPEQSHLNVVETPGEPKPQEDTAEVPGERKPQEDTVEIPDETKPQGDTAEVLGETKPQEDTAEVPGERKPQEDTVELPGETEPQENAEQNEAPATEAAPEDNTKEGASPPAES